MTFRKLRKSWINWTAIGIAMASLVALFILSIIELVFWISNITLSRATFYVTEYYTPLGEVELQDDETITNCSYIVSEKTEYFLDGVRVNYFYTVTTKNQYELNFEYFVSDEDYVKIDGASMDIAKEEKQYLEPGVHNFEVSINYSRNSGPLPKAVGEVYFGKITKLNGKDVTFTYSVSDDVLNEFEVLDPSDYELHIKYIEKEQGPDIAKFLGVYALCVLGYYIALGVFEIVIGVKAHQEKKKN